MRCPRNEPDDGFHAIGVTQAACRPCGATIHDFYAQRVPAIRQLTISRQARLNRRRGMLCRQRIASGRSTGAREPLAARNFRAAARASSIRLLTWWKSVGWTWRGLGLAGRSVRGVGAQLRVDQQRVPWIAASRAPRGGSGRRVSRHVLGARTHTFGAEPGRVTDRGVVDHPAIDDAPLPPAHRRQ
jgi:hypothetical protein